MKTKYLFMSLGHPGSGKTYFTERLAGKIGAVRINADALRMNMFGSFDAARQFDAETGYLNQVVFKALDYATVQILKSDTSVIYDVQQNQRMIRDKTSQLGIDNGAVPVIIWVKTPVDIALQRGQDRDLTPDQQKHDYETMKASIEKHLQLIEHPTVDENVIVIDGTDSFDEQYLSFCDQIEKL
ncbi:MAG TPA: ATP-binding protein [Candidatus Microsaccharimonas sp.]|jgi:predicted kinase